MSDMPSESTGTVTEAEKTNQQLPANSNHTLEERFRENASRATGQPIRPPSGG